MKPLYKSALLLLALLFYQAGIAQEVEVTAEPSHHLVLQNAYVRVFRIEIAPGSATLLHRHRHDYIVVRLGASDVANEIPGQSVVRTKRNDGDTQFTPGNFAHVLRNLGNNPSRSVIVELLQDDKNRDSPARWDEDRGLHILHGGTQEILFAKDGTRASEVELQIAGAEPRQHYVGAVLLVAVSDLNLRMDQPGRSYSNLELKSGDIKWWDRGLTANLTNVGGQGAKYVLIEFP
jgi:hypothetical protein